MRSITDAPVHWAEYSSFASQINLLTAFPGLIPVVVDVVDGGTGSLVVRTAGVPASDTTWTVASGDRVEVRLKSIETGTNVTRLRVGFSDGK